LASHKQIVFDWGGVGSTNSVEVDGQIVVLESAPALTGSAVISNQYGDLDLESVWLVNYDSFRHTDLRSSSSPGIKGLVQFLQKYIKHFSANPRYRFVELKAGEYDYVPETAKKTQSKAIKWNQEQVARGWRWVQSKNGKREKLTLAEALASESRVKVDWVAWDTVQDPVASSLGISESWIEASVLLQIGGRSGGDSPVLGIAREDHLPSKGATGAHDPAKGGG
jgi:hypothetical protein